MTWRTIFPMGAVFLPALAMAQDEAAPAKQEVDLMHLFEAGGVMMPALAVLSVLTVVLILLYFLLLRRNAVVSDRFMNNAEALIRRNDFLGLISYCHRRNESMARITQRALEFMKLVEHRCSGVWGIRMGRRGHDLGWRAGGRDRFLGRLIIDQE